MPNLLKPIPFSLFNVMLWGMLSSISFAQPPDSKPPGFHGTLGLGIGQQEETSRSQFKIFTYKDDRETLRKIIPLPTLEFSYVDDFGQWGFGIFEGKLGLFREQITGIGTFKLEGGISITSDSNEFKNPYLLGSRRKKTSKSEKNQKLSYQLGEDIALLLSVSRIETLFEEDDTPKVHPDLGRKSITKAWSAGFQLFFIQIQGGRILTDAKGKADSSKGPQSELTVFIPLGDLLAVFSTRETRSTFNKIHPVFSQKRKDRRRDNFATIEFTAEPFSYYLIGASNRLNSNINFFDSTNRLIGFGVDYSF